MTRSPVVGAAAMLLASAGATAQPTFSFDYQGPAMIFGVDAFTIGGGPIFEGDIVSPPLPGPPLGAASPGPFPPGLWPGVVINAGPIFPGDPPGLGLLFGVFFLEVDALSYGDDALIPDLPLPAGSIFFSVDEFASGGPVIAAPGSLGVEGAAGFGESSADVLANLFALPALGAMAPAPPLPASPPAGNVGVLDGDGINPASGLPVPGLALAEPNPPTPGLVPDPGDNLDGLDMDTTPPDLLGPVFFSMDAMWPDALEGPGPPPNTGTAAANGALPGDVMMVAITDVTPMVVFAPAALLGLDAFGAIPGSDDLDALVLAENGSMIFEPSLVPFDWTTGATDMLLFSVRRGSGVIGAPDSLWGMPIEPGDILTTPIGGAAPGVNPAILIPAEWLGLATLRSGFPGLFGADDLDALDIAFDLDMPIDCNGNGIPDEDDVASGSGADCNGNAVPDECDLAGGAGDCDGSGTLDACDIAAGSVPDCNANGIPDSCDIAPAIDFAPAVSYATTWADTHVIAPDLDGDGDPDLVISSDAAPSLMLMFNAGGGAFGPDVSIAMPASQRDVVAADFDGDGDLDLAATTPTAADTVQVLLNGGGGAFGAPVAYTAGSYPWALAAGDLDGDGDVDLAVSNLVGDSVSVLLNGGTGAFAVSGPYASGDGPIAMAAADFDGDGDFDLATADRFGDTVSILANIGGAVYGAPVPVPTGAGPFSIAAADLDGDGDLDVATGDYEADTTSVLLNTAGALGAAATWPTIGVWRIAAADIDGDGDADLIGPEAILPNTGTATFGAVVPLMIGLYPGSVAPADFDADGDPDLAVVAGGATLVGVWVAPNVSAPGVSADADGDGIPDECGPSPADFDGDGDVDIVDLLAILSAWGPCPGCPEDLNGDGFVGIVDLLLLLAAYTG